MTTRELTSGFDFWSRGHLRVAVVHLHIKYGEDIFIQFGFIDIFPKFKMAVFSEYVNLAIRVCLTVWYLCSVPNWVTISALVTEIDALMLQTFI